MKKLATRRILVMIVIAAMLLSGSAIALAIAQQHKQNGTTATTATTATTTTIAMAATAAGQTKPTELAGGLEALNKGDSDLSPAERLQQLSEAQNFVSPQYRTVVDLAMANGPQKPASTAIISGLPQHASLTKSGTPTTISGGAAALAFGNTASAMQAARDSKTTAPAMTAVTPEAIQAALLNPNLKIEAEYDSRVQLLMPLRTRASDARDLIYAQIKARLPQILSASAKSEESSPQWLSMSKRQSTALSLNPLLSITGPRVTLPHVTLPTPTQTSSIIRVLTPLAGVTVMAGEPFLLQWTWNSNRVPTYNIYLVTASGQEKQLAVGVAHQSQPQNAVQQYQLTVPDMQSAGCRFRIDAIVTGTSTYASDFSESFNLVVRPTPSPTRNPTPMPKPSPTGTTPTNAPTNAPTPAPVPPDVPHGYASNGIFFINRQQDPVRWFSLNVKTAQADKIIWQVAKSPFQGLDFNTMNPPGLLASGTLAPKSQEFAIDFEAIVKPLEGKLLAATSGTGGALGAPPVQNQGAIFTSAPEQTLLPARQYALYVRAFALDAVGKVIGDPGAGTATGFGSPIMGINPALNGPNLPTALVQTWSEAAGEETKGTYQRPYLHQANQALYAHDKDNYWDFEFRTTPKNTVAFEIQVTTSPYAGTAENSENPAGLVHRKRVDKGTFMASIPIRWQLDLSAFTPPAAAMGTSTILYYMRAVFFCQDPLNPGIVYPVTSEVQKIYYNNLELSPIVSELQLAASRRVTVKSNLPMTKFMNYFPVQWEHPNAEVYFEITRRIMAAENSLRITLGNLVIEPYPVWKWSHMAEPDDAYQALLDTLPIGLSMKLTVKSSWWDDFWSLLGDIYKAISKAYEGIKSSVASFIVNNIPLIDSDTRKLLRTAVDAAINVGLTALGLPPTLPNFERLAADGIDAALEIAIDETCQAYGIPRNEITEEVKNQLLGELHAQIEEAAKINHLNPLNLGFLKPATSKLYQPARLMVLVQNFSNEVSPRGTLTVNYHAQEHFTHFYSPKPVTIPQLLPGSHIILFIYMEPKISKPWADYKTAWDKYYLGNGGPCILTVNAVYTLPDAAEEAKRQHLIPTDQTLSLIPIEYVYDREPVYTYTRIAPPCDTNIEPDPHVNVNDFQK